MKATVEYKGKQVTIDIPDAKLEALIAQKPRTGYERARKGDTYYASNIHREEGFSLDFDDFTSDDNAFAAAAYYTDERLARDNARADKLMRQLRRYAAEHGGIPSVEDWARGSGEKWAIQYLHYRKTMRASIWNSYHLAGAVYFCSEKACKSAITEFHDELLWYFTEYDPQVRA